jgi:hypothetical protein
MEFSFGPSYSFNHDNWLYAATVDLAPGDRRYLLSEMNFHMVRANLRANLTFSPTLTLQAYLAPFYATVQRVAYKQLTSPRAARYADRFTPVARDASQPDEAVLDVDGDNSFETNLGAMDYAVTSFNSNFVLRWEYRPGSTIFVVWQQNRNDFTFDGRFRMRDIGGSIVEARPANIFLVKLNYWLSL